MNRWQRHIVRLAALLVATAILVPAAQAGGNVGDAGLAQGILETHFGFSPARAVDWTTGVCSFADRPGSCYLSTKQAAAQSYAEALSMGARPTLAPSTTSAEAVLLGEAGLARGILETNFGFTPSRAADWTTGVCTYGDNPSSCYLSGKQAVAQSSAEAQAMGVQPLPSSPTPVAVSAPSAFHWGDAGIGAAATLGIVLILAGLAVYVARSRRRQPVHA
jgi:hypothetical protein